MPDNIERPIDSGNTWKVTARRLFRHENAVLIFVLIALIGGFAGVSKGLTSRLANALNIMLQSSIRGVASIGQLFVLLSGNIDLSVGGMGLFCAILGSLLMTTQAYNIVGFPVSMYLVLPIMLLVGAGWGASNGLLTSRIGMPSLIVTLGMWKMTEGIAFQLSAGHSITMLPEKLAWIGQGTIGDVPVPALIFIGVAVVAYFVLRHTTFGRSVYAVGGNVGSAWLSGINVKWTQLLAFVISGFLAGLSGIITIGRIMSASMRTLEGLELDSIAAVCIGGVSLMGGRGNLIGAVIGVMIISVINNGMSVLGAGPAVQDIAKGAIIVTAVAIDYLRRRQA
jgi:ribose/xylose/arabinose/galactoside ABC-type transport system permease subunit